MNNNRGNIINNENNYSDFSMNDRNSNNMINNNYIFFIFNYF